MTTTDDYEDWQFDTEAPPELPPVEGGDDEGAALIDGGVVGGYVDHDEDHESQGSVSMASPGNPFPVDSMFSTGFSPYDTSATQHHDADEEPQEDQGTDDVPKLFHKPTDEKEWHQKTADTLANARALTRHAAKSLMTHAQERDGSSKKNHVTTSSVHASFRRKIGASEDLIKALEDRIESVEDTLRQVGDGLFALQRAHRSKWAPLNVCERRLELREARPLQEQVKDKVQEALEHERQTLIESRQELQDQILSSREMSTRLENMKSALLQDLQHKRHGLRIDRACLSPNTHTVNVRQDRVVLPSIMDVPHYGAPLSPNNAARHTGPQNEGNRQIDTRTLITNAVRLEEDAMRLLSSCDAAMIHTKKEAMRASQMVQSALTKRLQETHDLKSKLEQQMQVTDETITHTEISLAKTKKSLESHDHPLRALDSRFHKRGRRIEQEKIRDDVHDDLETHLDVVKHNVKSLAHQYKSTKDLLDQLHAAKHVMQGDYRAKCAAAKIDDLCMKVTARKAIELDRMDPRGGRCVQSSARSKANSNRSKFGHAEASFTSTWG
mmetsp:Transcript_96363/g.272559  ORF Transcript_96363/g.272559 Transcript_96363/m.272559 type:complete len:554 (-) Transcript_96363:79-1740(-)